MADKPVPPAIYGKLVDILSELDAVPKARQTSGPGNYKFRGIDDVVNALNPLLAKHRVIYYPSLQHLDSKLSVRSSGTEWERATILVDYVFVAADDGSSVTVRVIGEGMDSSDKATNKALSGALKYALLQLFAITTEDMEDQDASRPGENDPVHRQTQNHKPSPREAKDDPNEAANLQQIQRFAMTLQKQHGFEGSELKSFLNVETSKVLPLGLWRHIIDQCAKRKPQNAVTREAAVKAAVDVWVQNGGVIPRAEPAEPVSPPDTDIANDSEISEEDLAMFEDQNAEHEVYG